MPFSQRLGLSYNIQRPYSIRYLQPIVITILFVFFCLVTLFNVAANGYDTQTMVTNDPNATVAQTYWFLNPIFTFGDNKLSPKCQPSNLLVGSQLVTTNLGEVYTLVSVTDEAGANQPSLAYLNQTLESCNVQSVDISLVKMESTGGGTIFDWQGSTVRVNTQCQIRTADGVYNLSLVSPSSVEMGGRTIRNITSHASAWWGRELLNHYIGGLFATAIHLMNGTSSPFTLLQMQYLVRNATSLERDDMFDVNHQVLRGDGSWYWDTSFPNPDQAAMFNNETFALSHPLTEGLALAKMYYCFVLVDLGQNREPNYLLDNRQLERVTKEAPYNFNRITNGWLNDTTSPVWTIYNGIDLPRMGKGHAVPQRETYDVLRNITGPLGTRAATISSQYLCTVPSKKNIGIIVWSTLVANFILLQAVHLLTMFLVGFFVFPRDPTAMYCEGCCLESQVGKAQGDEDHVSNITSPRDLKTPNHADEEFSFKQPDAYTFWHSDAERP